MSGFEAKNAMNYELKAYGHGSEEKRMRKKKKMVADILGRLGKNIMGQGRKVMAYDLSWWVPWVVEFLAKSPPLYG